MADIRKDDVRKYVRELIAKEFGSNKNGKNVLSDNFKTTVGGYGDGQLQPSYNQLLKQE